MVAVSVRLLLIGLLAFRSLPANADTAQPDEATAARFAGLALTCLHQEYPNHISLTLSGDGDIRPPRELTPAFYGCLDWHSAVHGHWLLVRLLRIHPNGSFAAAARDMLAKNLTPENIRAEVAHVTHPGRASFERPYGLAWLLALAGELRAWDDPQAKVWAQAIAPLEAETARRLTAYLPRLYYPIRIGEHAQTAFSLGLIWDWAKISGNADMRDLLVKAADRYYRRDRACPLAFEPSGEDFLSPCLAEADFMRRVLPPKDFSQWLAGFLPRIRAGQNGTGLQPGIVTDRSDPKLAHIDGLNLSRAWMLQGIAHGLPARDGRIPGLLAASSRHADAALPHVTGEHYEGGHWLGTFAVYLTTKAGIR